MLAGNHHAKARLTDACFAFMGKRFLFAATAALNYRRTERRSKMHKHSPRCVLAEQVSLTTQTPRLRRWLGRLLRTIEERMMC